LSGDAPELKQVRVRARGGRGCAFGENPSPTSMVTASHRTLQRTTLHGRAREAERMERRTSICGRKRRRSVGSMVVDGGRRRPELDYDGASDGDRLRASVGDAECGQRFTTVNGVGQQWTAADGGGRRLTAANGADGGGQQLPTVNDGDRCRRLRATAVNDGRQTAT